jgi:hypothetical protein
MSELSPIEMKKENISEEQKKKKSDWKNFGKSILYNLIYTILIGLIGSNFVYVLYSNLDTWFPSDPNKLPYQNSQSLREKASRVFSNIKSLFKGGGDDTGDFEYNVCNNLKKNIQHNSEKYSKLFKNLGFNEVGFPYTFINNESGIVNIFKNLFGESARYSYVSGRELLKIILRFFISFDTIGENLVFVFALPILSLLLLFQIPTIFGFLTSCISFILTYFKSMSTNYGWIITIIVSLFTFLIIFSIGSTWSGMIGITQIIQLFTTFLIMPLLDFDKVRQIFFCKSHILSILFTVMMISSSLKYLEDIIAFVMIIVLCILTYGGLKNTKKI